MSWPDAKALAALTDLRVRSPALSLELAHERQRPDTIAPGGKCNIIAADHPARGVLRVGGNSLRMANRAEYLGRIVEVLRIPDVDGVMATMDVLEDLLVLDFIARESGHRRFLQGKSLVASCNRGGLAGAAWELEDPITAATADSIRSYGLDGAKLLWRLDLSDDRSLRTMQHCADAIRELNRLEVPIFLEPLAAFKSDGGVVIDHNAATLARTVGIASALGDSSRNLWLKLPLTERFAEVCSATTLPIVVLGGPAKNTREFVEKFSNGVGSAPNVRGAMLGRNVLYPSGHSAAAVARVIAGIVHNRWSTDRALADLDASTTA